MQHVRMATAQDRTYDWLKERIAGFAQDEGVFLTEAEVASAAGVSRTPVREAMLRLEAEGLLQIVPKKGAYVPPLSQTQIEATMEARTLIEQWAAGRVAEAGAPTPPGLADLLDSQARFLAEADTAAFIEADRRFHSTIVRAAGNPVLADVYDSLRDRQIRMELRALAVPHRGRDVLAEHAAILDALTARDPERLRAAVEAHLAGTLAAFRHRP